MKVDVLLANDAGCGGFATAEVLWIDVSALCVLSCWTAWSQSTLWVRGQKFPPLAHTRRQTHTHSLALTVAHRSLDCLICLNPSAEGRDLSDCNWQLGGGRQRIQMFWESFHHTPVSVIATPLFKLEFECVCLCAWVCVCVCERVCVCLYMVERERRPQREGGFVRTRGLSFPSLEGGKGVRKLFHSTNHFQSDPWRELPLLALQNGRVGGRRGALNDFQSHFGTAQSLSAVYTEHFKTYH